MGLLVASPSSDDCCLALLPERSESERLACGADVRWVTRWERLGQDVSDDVSVDVGEAEVAALESVGETFVVDA